MSISPRWSGGLLRNDPEDHPVDLRRAGEVVLVGEQDDLVLRRPALEDERPSPDRVGGVLIAELVHRLAADDEALVVGRDLVEEAWVLGLELDAHDGR
jgi:hypothetical protein